ncbi:MAG: ATP-binding protein [Gemmatimonadaceae bacterium]
MTLGTSPDTALPTSVSTNKGLAEAARHSEWPRGWLMLTLLGTSAMAAWQRKPSWSMLVLAIVSTIGALIAIRTVRAPRVWAIAALISLSVALSFGLRETLTLNSIDSNWSSWSEAERSERATKVVESMRELTTKLMNSSVSIVQSLPNGATSFVPPSLEVPATGRTESAVLLFHDGRLVAHAGQTRVPLAVGAPGLSLLQTPFYTAMVARASSSDNRFQAVSVVLLSSAPPADRFTHSLVQDVVGARGASEVEILPPLVTSKGVVPYEHGVNFGSALFARVVAEPQGFGEAREAALERARVRTSIPLLLTALFMLVTSWRRPARTRERILMLFALMAVIALAPLGALSNLSSVFDAGAYFAPMGGRLTANVAALVLTASLCLCGLFLVLRSPKLYYSRAVAIALVLAAAGAGPFIMRDLARGISLPATGAGTKLWIAWQLAIALASASILVGGASAGQVAIGSRRGLPSWLAPGLACIAALMAVPSFEAPGAWPVWYPVLWILAIVLLAFVRRSLALVAGAAVVAGCAAVTLTWAATVRTRMHYAVLDVTNLAVVDSNAVRFLENFTIELANDTQPPREHDALLRRYANSDLARAGFGARIARWVPSMPNTPIVDLQLAPVADSIHAQAAIAAIARSSGHPEMRTFPSGPVLILISAIPSSDGGVTTIAIPPSNSLKSLDPFESITGLAVKSRAEPPYRITVEPSIVARDPMLSAPPVPTGGIRWHRRDNIMHGDAVSRTNIPVPVHVEVDLRGADALIPRGAILVLFDVAVVVLLWGASAMSDGAVGRWLRQRGKRLSRSYRVRLSFALLLFFVVPAAAFAVWAGVRLREDDHAARELSVRESLRVAALSPSRSALAEVSKDVGAPLYLYRDGQLTAASDTVLDLLAPIGRLLPTALTDVTATGPDADDFETLNIPAGANSALVGYRRVRIERDTTRDSTRSLSLNAVVATPASGNDFELDKRRADLAVQVLLGMSLGVFAALWLSGVASRSLSRPVGNLRAAALSLAGGRRALALDASPPSEFAPVFQAFERMADDLLAGRNALEAAQRRTEAVLQHVASGVLAVRTDGTVIISNPRAEAILGIALRDGVSVASYANAESLAPLFTRVANFLVEDVEDDSFDVTVNSRQLSARITRLPTGAVVTLDDVTELASAQRVLAWGEMARQVAHEIKNPLTPIRLGVQHLRRAFRDKRGDFGDILETNVGRVLEEIDHLDEIARAFSRYGTVPAEREAAEVVSLIAVVQAVLALESLGDSGVMWSLKTSVTQLTDRAWARVAELKEVLLNLLENARLAQATLVEVHVDRDRDVMFVSVTDNGMGISAEVLPRIFEPHFSTRTSGSGLGLAISRRLIEGWGGTVDVSSTVGTGTTVRIILRAAE